MNSQASLYILSTLDLEIFIVATIVFVYEKNYILQKNQCKAVIEGLPTKSRTQKPCM